ncbi:uncharacterized protein EV420DRAFT_1603805 [Desarmillaria tabescens]|uniref:Survival motor neuron Tudor domain-containing protein n=1 Tax=Armillaria tabescens TaxID=1929756 RepID=A0AA39IZK8_ARMTA|nr:uncharacterized protein EV420DRAFT_1603805 [Desarmillaria tabescens]KAK0432749.1 hypothetical protein EV420DRAFT_1603805 [Desarmillaria tabescens]
MRPVVSYDDIVPDPHSYMNRDSRPPVKKPKTNGNASVAFEHSRELTHAEIWNDSVLIDAWEAVHEEYAAYHGGDTALKTNPTKRSPLWYNVPVSDDSKVEEDDTENLSFPEEEDDDDESDDDDSKSIDFKTFVPSHDASLNSGEDLVTDASSSPPQPPAETVSQDEAFTRAVNAMYWAGYWTAMYQCQRNNVVDAEEGEVEGMVSEFVSTQR